MSSTTAMNLPSLCIPRVFPNITEARIYKIFGDLNLGDIERIDIVSKTAENGDKYNRVFVHFKRWNTNAHTDEVRGRLLNGKDIKIIYDEPWFWKVSAYRPPAPRPQQAPRPHQGNKYQRPKATIELHNEPELESFEEAVLASNRIMDEKDRWQESRSHHSLQRYSGHEEWMGYGSQPTSVRHPIQRGFTRCESGSEAWMDRRPQEQKAPVKPRKFRQNRPNLSECVKPNAQRPTSGVTKAIMEEGEEPEN